MKDYSPFDPKHKIKAFLGEGITIGDQDDIENSGAIYLKNSNTTGYADIELNFGLPGDKPVTGDWDSNGTDTIGIFRDGSFYLRNSNTIGYADLAFGFGVSGDMPVAGRSWLSGVSMMPAKETPFSGELVLPDDPQAEQPLSGPDSASTGCPVPEASQAVTICYEYDPLQRLVEANYSNGDYYHYEYDQVGNRTKQTTSLSGQVQVTDYVYDAANRLSSVKGVQYIYDNNGNLLFNGVTTYAYDNANHLLSASNAPGTTSFAYSGLGDRLQQTVNGVTTTFTVDLASGLTQTLDDGTYAYLYGNGRVAQTNATSIEYFLGDALGSVRKLTDAAGAVTLEKSYDPYGQVSVSSGAGQTSYGFTGEFQSQEAIYLRARHYSPSTGRFLSRDMWQGDIRQPMSYNMWLYGYSNPTDFTDPSGQFPVECLEAINQARCIREWMKLPMDGSLTSEGEAMYGLFKRWRIAFDLTLTPREFFGWMMYFEMNGIQNNTFSLNDGVSQNSLKVIDMMEEIAARQLFGDATGGAQGHPPYCVSSTCESGLFNFLGKYAQVARDRIDDDPLTGSVAIDSLNYPCGYQQMVKPYMKHRELIADVRLFAGAVLDTPKPEWKQYDNNKPYHWGNDSWVLTFSGAIGTLDKNGIIYRNGNFAFLTENQATCQKIGGCPR